VLTGMATQDTGTEHPDREGNHPWRPPAWICYQKWQPVITQRVAVRLRKRRPFEKIGGESDKEFYFSNLTMLSSAGLSALPCRIQKFKQDLARAFDKLSTKSGARLS